MERRRLITVDTGESVRTEAYEDLDHANADHLPAAAPSAGRQVVGRADQRSPAKRSFSGTAAPVVSRTRTKVSTPINSPNRSLPILRKKMFSP